MEFNKHYIFIALALLLVLPLTDAGLSRGEIDDILERPDLRDLGARQITVDDRLDEAYEVRVDGVYFKDLRQNNPFVWIDKVIGTTYHVDSDRDFVENESISLTFFYNVQPDYINHYTHSGKFDRAYFASQWEWVANCSGEFDCSGGWVTIEVFNIEEGRGSSTFPIGTTGPQWATQGQDFGEFNGVSGNLRREFFGITQLSEDDNFTISIWLKYVDDFGGVVFNNVITGSDRISMSATADKLKVNLYNGTDYYRNETSVNIIPPDTWTNFLVTYDNSTNNLTIYLNGIQDSINSILSGTSGGAGFSIGSRTDNQAISYFNGTLDEILGYNRPLSQAEITTLFAQYTVTSSGVDRTGTPSTTGLVLDINFDNFSIADQSTSQNNPINTNVSFGVVFNDLTTLVLGTDYSLNLVNGLFTILNTDYTWNGLFVSWSYISSETCPAGINPERINTLFGEFIDGLLGFLGIIGIVLGVIWLVLYVNKLFTKGGLNDLGQTA